MNSSGNNEQNLQQADRIAYLVAGHLNGSLTTEEKDELDDWITDSDENLALFEKLTDEDNIDAAMQQYHSIEVGKSGAWERLKQKIDRKPSTLRIILPWLVAASVVLAALTIFVLKNEKPLDTNNGLAHRTTTPDRSAGTDKAVLTLSDGRTVILDSAGRGSIATEGGISINKNGNGTITYNGTVSEMRYNTVATPRGGQFSLTLADGTRVWLNADSWLKFPAGFATAERVLELRGEAYFEVAKDKERPFRVKILTQEGEAGTVQVLGTKFNINGYNDEGDVKTTLVEGAVEIRSGSERKTLLPGQVASIGNGIKLIAADVAEETAWKAGVFLFRNATTRSIAEQVKRWYDIEVVHEGTNNNHFNLEVARSIPLSRLLQALEKTGQVHFKLDEKKLTIRP
jgi:transmembrane sensor